MPTIINGTTGIDTVQDGIITADKIVSGAVTDAKIAAMAATKLTGQVPDANAPSGSVIQVVQTTYTSEFSTTSTSFTATGLTASITPSNSSNKILVVISTTQTCTSSSTNTYFTVYRNGSNIGFGSDSCLAKYVATSGYVITPVAISYLDAPSTTSSTTYTGYFRTTGGTGYVNSAVSGTITLMEIAA